MFPQFNLKRKLLEFIQKSVTARGAVCTFIMFYLPLLAIFLTLRLITLLDRLMNPNHDFRIENVLDFFGIPILIIILHTLISIGILLDGGKNFQEGFLFNSAELTLYGTGLFLFLCGHGAHIIANYLALLAIKFDIPTIHPEFYHEMWFLDEIFTHWIELTGFYLLIIYLSMLNLRIPSLQKKTKKEKWVIFGGASLAGLIWAPLMIESEYYWGSIIISIFSIILYLSYLRKNYLMKHLSTQYKIIYGILIFYSFTLVGLILYYFLLGGFIQPSELIKVLNT